MQWGSFQVTYLGWSLKSHTWSIQSYLQSVDMYVHRLSQKLAHSVESHAQNRPKSIE